MPPQPAQGVSRWFQKTACSLRGLRVAVLREDSFIVQGPVTLGVIAAAWWLGCDRTEWLLLTIAITGAFCAEVMNTAIEHLARAVTREENPDIRNALDVASGAVLAACVGSAIVGFAVLAPKLWP